MRILIATLALSASLLLTACERKADDPFAVSAEPQALMQLAFPGWQKDAAVVTQIRWPEANASGIPREESGWVLVQPELVATLSTDRVALIVSGRPSDEKGWDHSSHASSGNLGAYWFERREGKWYAAGKQESFTWTGFSGDVGHVSIVPLDTSRQAIAVENGSCWQGQCGKWLSLYALNTHNISPLLEKNPFIQIESENTGSGQTCELLDEEPGSTHSIRMAINFRPMDCFEVIGTWQIKPGNTQPGDLLINFSGKRTTTQPEPVAIDKPATPSASASETPNDEPTEEYRVTVNVIKNTLTYRFKDGTYRHLSGENPAPGI